ncbi:MAG: hypothetical protein AAFR74_00650 [Pseudomonadota bacterium]
MGKPILECDLLLAGGLHDPNLPVLEARAASLGLTVKTCYHGPDTEPGLHWDLNQETLEIDGAYIKARAGFLRYDVFSNPNTPSSNALDRAHGWYATLAGWFSDQAQLRVFNREHSLAATNKTTFIAMARRFGLPIPTTYITNSKSHIDPSSVIKPVGGGAYCRDYSDLVSETEWLNGKAPMPVFAQERLSYPEFRVFIIGEESAVFRVNSEALDHRSSHKSETVYLETLPEPLEGLMQKLFDFSSVIGLDFCAYDLKSAPDGSLRVLEVNSSPMFAAFDAIAAGDVSAKMLHELCGG